MRQDERKVIPFPVERMRPNTGVQPAPADQETRMLFAASASAAASETVVDMVARTAPAPSDDEGYSMAVNVGILWGAILGIAERHGQVPAVFALEHLIDKLRSDPDRFLTKQQEEFAAAEEARCHVANVLGALMVESHPGPYVTNDADVLQDA
ncbi:MAG: hypothetical protein MI806_19745 [Minwuiales bacterium]|nr:hypothetical protein [Minwuiales bacterium]